MSLEKKVRELGKTYGDLSEFLMIRAKEAHEEWKLNDADKWRMQSLVYSHFVDKLEEILKDYSV